MEVPAGQAQYRAMMLNLLFRNATGSMAAGVTAPIAAAVLKGMRKFAEIHAPVLAIYAVPHSTARPFKDENERTAAQARDEAVTAQASALQIGVPGARVIRLPHANLFVFLSNADDVAPEMRAFVDALPTAEQ